MSRHISMNYKSDGHAPTILQLGDMALVGYRLTALLRSHGYLASYLGYANPGIKDEDKLWARAFSTTPSDRTHRIRLAVESLVESRKYDIVHAHSIFAIPLILQSRGFALHLHGTDIRVYSRQMNALGFAMRKLLRMARFILVSTPDLVPLVGALGREARFLPSPLDFRMFCARESPLDLRDGVDFVLFHPSRHSPSTKRNDILISAIKQAVNDGYDLRVFMVDSDIYVRESKDLISKLGLEKRVVWLQSIPGSQMPDYYNASDIVCDQFLIDGALCLVTLEAMACGRPVVTKFNNIEIGTNGYMTVPPLPVVTNATDVTERIENLLDSPSQRKYEGERGALWVRNEHTPERILAVLEQCYRTVVQAGEAHA